MAAKDEPVAATVLQSVPPDAAAAVKLEQQAAAQAQAAVVKQEPGAAAAQQAQAAVVKQGSAAAAPAIPSAPPHAVAAAAQVVATAAAPSSVASPTTAATLSPRQSTPHGVYPKPLATHDAVLADETLFMETFYSFHTAMKNRPTIPKMGGKDLDVHLLYREVTSRGGLQSVIRDRKWKEITLVFDLPRTTTSASYVLRKYYITLLFHYEQVYRNAATGSYLTPPALSGSSPSVQPGDSAISEGVEPPIRKRVRKRRIPQPVFPAIDPAEAIGSTVVGAIEGKLDFGYLVTMVVGGEKLKGVLYHVPPGNRTQYASLPGLLNSMSAEIRASGEIQTRRKRRRKEEMPKKDPNAPRPNRTGYNFFFAEQRQRLKLLHPDKDREISRMIGEAWNALTEEEKLPYQQRGEEDKERFKREFLDYREKLKSGYYDNPANVNANGQEKTEEVTVSPEGPRVPEAGLSSATSVPPVANSGHARVSEQLNSGQNPAPSVVPTQ